MAAPTAHYYWDACIFVAYLNKAQVSYDAYLDQIAQFLEECQRGECVIYTSALTIAEIPRHRLTSSGYDTFSEFLEDYSGAIVQVVADPLVMACAGELRGLTYTKNNSPPRTLDTPDAIHLASALALVGDYDVKLTAFHTFDNGKKRGTEGSKSVPLLTFETWCESCTNDVTAKQVCALNRTRPDHPDPRLPLPTPTQPADPATTGPEPVAFPAPQREDEAVEKAVTNSNGSVPKGSTELAGAALPLSNQDAQRAEHST